MPGIAAKSTNHIRAIKELLATLPLPGRKRFINPQTEKPFFDTPPFRRSIVQSGKSDLDQSIPRLGEHMWKIAQSAANNKVALVSAGPIKSRPTE